MMHTIKSNLFGQHEHAIEFIDSFQFSFSLVTFCSYLWYPFSFVIYLVSNHSYFFALQIMKNFLMDLLAWLSFCMIHQLVEYCCITTKKVMNLFSFLMNPLFFFLESFFWRKLARPTILISLLFVISLLKLFKWDTFDKPRITSSCSIVC